MSFSHPPPNITPDKSSTSPGNTKLPAPKQLLSGFSSCKLWISRRRCFPCVSLLPPRLFSGPLGPGAQRVFSCCTLGNQGLKGGRWLLAIVSVFSASFLASQVLFHFPFAKEKVGAERLGEKEDPNLHILLGSKACPSLLS